MFPDGYAPTAEIEHHDHTPKISFVEIYDIDTKSVHYLNLKATKYINPFDATEKHVVILKPTGDSVSETSKGGGILALETAMLTQIKDAVDTRNEQDGISRSVVHTKDTTENLEHFEATESYIFDLLNEVTVGITDDVQVTSSRKRSVRSNDISSGLYTDPINMKDNMKKKRRVTFVDDGAINVDNMIPKKSPTTPFPIFGSEPPNDRGISHDDLQLSLLWIDEPHFKTVYESLGVCTNRTAWPMDYFPAVVKLMKKMAKNEYLQVLSEALPYTQLDHHAQQCTKRMMKHHRDETPIIIQNSLQSPCVEYSSVDNIQEIPIDVDYSAKIAIVRGILAVTSTSDITDDTEPTFTDIGGGQILHTVHHHLLDGGSRSINPLLNISTAPCIQANQKASRLCAEIRKILMWDTPCENRNWMQYRQQNAKCPSVTFSTNLIGDHSTSIVGTPVVDLPAEVDTVTVEYSASSKLGCVTTTYDQKGDVTSTINETRRQCKSKLEHVKSALRKHNYTEINKLSDTAHSTTINVVAQAIEPLCKTEHVCICYDSIQDDYLISSALLPTTFRDNTATCVLMHQGPLGRFTTKLVSIDGGSVEDDRVRLDTLCSHYAKYCILGKMKQNKIVEQE